MDLKYSLAMSVAAGALLGAVSVSAQNTSSLSYELVLDGLENPWDMAFLDDGTMLFTEKCKGLSVLMPDGTVNALYGMGGTDGYPSSGDDLFCEGQAGMMGVAFDPAFSENRRIYVYSTSNMTAPGTNRLMRMVVNDDFTGVSDRTDIVDDVEYKPLASDHPFGGPGAHNGGRVRFGPQGALWLTTGDTHNEDVPQSPTRMGSKIMRMDTDGNAHADNTPPEGFDARTFTYGHGWDPRENMAGRDDCPDGYCGYSPNQMDGMNRYERASFMPMTDLDTYPDAMVPMWDNNGWSQGSSSNAFLGDNWGPWAGHMVVGVMGIGFGGTPIGQRIDVFELSDDGTEVFDVVEMTLPDGMEAGRFRSVVIGPDGSLYTAVDEGLIQKLTP